MSPAPPASTNSPAPEAVLLDVGGVFLLPNPGAIGVALDLAGVDVDRDALDEAHYRGAAAFELHDDPFADHPIDWNVYLRAYCSTLGVPADCEAETVEHLSAAFVTMGTWTREIPGAREGLAEIVATDVAVGIVSNADGTIGAILRELEVLQVGPGPGVSVRCLIDSGEVGVEKPDPRIFRIALEALGVEAERAWYVGDTPAIDVVGARRAGLRPFLIDPFALHADAPFETVENLGEVARLVAQARCPDPPLNNLSGR